MIGHEPSVQKYKQCLENVLLQRVITQYNGKRGSIDGGTLAKVICDLTTIQIGRNTAHDDCEIVQD